MRSFAIATIALLLICDARAEVADPANDMAGFLRAAVAAACAAGDDEVGFAGALDAVPPLQTLPNVPGRIELRGHFVDGGRIRSVAIVAGGRLRRLTVEYFAPFGRGRTRPTVAAVTDGDCQVRETRRIHYDTAGRAERLIILGPDFATETGREPLNPPVPDGRDPGEIAVATIDTGVNYLLPEVTPRLARDRDGQMLGRDFWDLDGRPFDLDTARSPFFPLHHGTAVASILLREAPAARLVPYRFPRPMMQRMAALIEDVENNGVRIATVAMGSNDRDDWREFDLAAAAHAHILFVVSAGNDGRDIDRAPIYPAALGLPNLLVVTSADAFGRLAPGSNWGAKTVDVMVPGENVPVIDHRGAAGKASGSSFAVPRVAAMAARMLAKNPSWRAPELKAAILARAKPSPYEKRQVVRVGWIPDPTDDF